MCIVRIFWCGKSVWLGYWCYTLIISRCQFSTYIGARFYNTLVFIHGTLSILDDPKLWHFVQNKMSISLEAEA